VPLWLTIVRVSATSEDVNAHANALHQCGRTRHRRAPVGFRVGAGDVGFGAAHRAQVTADEAGNRSIQHPLQTGSATRLRRLSTTGSEATIGRQNYSHTNNFRPVTGGFYLGASALVSNAQRKSAAPARSHSAGPTAFGNHKGYRRHAADWLTLSNTGDPKARAHLRKTAVVWTALADQAVKNLRNDIAYETPIVQQQQQPQTGKKL